MTTDFDTIIDRRNTSCLKYDFAVERGYPAGIAPFWVADMDFRVPQPVIDELVCRSQHGIFGYTDPKEDYRQTLLDWFRTYHDWSPSATSLTITPGVVFALCMAVRAFTSPGEAVLIQQPVYYPFTESIRDNGRKLINSPLILKDGRYTIDFQDFEQQIQQQHVRLFLLCSPHNPVGRVWTREELQQMADICARHDVLIAADEIHHEFIRPGFHHTVLASLSPEIADRVITCTSPSKAFNLAGLQVSNIFIENDSLRRKFRQEVAAAGYSQPNALGLFAAQAAYARGREWLTDLLAYLEENYQFTRQYLQQHLPKVQLIEPEGTYLLWLDFSAYGLTNDALDQRIIHQANLWLDSGHIFGPSGQGFQRLNIACPRSVLAKGLQQLATAFAPLQ